MHSAILPLLIWCVSTVAGLRKAAAPALSGPSNFSMAIIGYDGSVCPKGNVTTAPTLKFDQQASQFFVSYPGFIAAADGPGQNTSQPNATWKSVGPWAMAPFDEVPCTCVNPGEDREMMNNAEADCTTSIQVNYTDSAAWKFDIKAVTYNGAENMTLSKDFEFDAYKSLTSSQGVPLDANSTCGVNSFVLDFTLKFQLWWWKNVNASDNWIQVYNATSDVAWKSCSTT